jgi:hypothetical protein
MRIISNRTVELTDAEAAIKRQFDALLSAGWNTQQALTRTKDLNQGFDPAFFRWLADEGLMPDNEVESEKPMTPGYQESLRVFCDLLEPENLDAGFDNEYVRGGVNLIADLFGIPGLPVDERMDQVLADLRNLKVNDEQPNLFERMENLIAALESAMQHIADDNRHNSDEYNDVNNAYGIAGEILTMIDGR